MKPCRLFTSTLFLLLAVFNMPLLSQTNYNYDLKSFLLKFNSTPDTSNWYTDNYLITGLPSLDSLNEEYSIIGFNPIFRILHNDPFNKNYIFHSAVDVIRMEELIQEYEADSNICWTGLNYKLIFCYNPSDPERNEIAFGSLVGIDLYKGFDLEMGQSNVIVGVIDNGMSYTISELAYSTSQHNFWINPGEDLDNDGVLFDEDDINDFDDDGNGLVDDFHGWNFFNNSNSLSGASHGTCMGNAIAAFTDNEEGIIGIGGGKWGVHEGVKLLPLQGNSLGYMIPAIEYGMQYCDIINMSFIVSPVVDFYIDEDFPDWVPLMEEVQSHDCLLIAGAGNYCPPIITVQDHVYAPANSVYVIAVTSTSSNAQHEIILADEFACYGPEIDICAPGVDVPLVNKNGYISEQSGTSVSTAIVSGIAALLKSYNPNLDYQDLWDLIVDNAENIDASNPGYEGMLGAGQVKAYFSLSAVYSPCAPGNLELEIISTHPHLTWNPSDPDVEEYHIWRKIADRGNVLEPWGFYDQVNGDICEYTDDLFGYCPSSPWTAYYKVRAVDAADLYSDFSNTVSTQGYPGIEKTAQVNLRLLSQTYCGSLLGGLTNYGNYLYVNIGLVGLSTYDISNPANPVLTDFIPGWNEPITGLEIDREYLFAPGANHLTAYGLSDPEFPQATSADYGWGNWSTCIYSMGNYIIKTFFNPNAPFAENTILEIYESEDILNPNLIWSFIDTSSAAYSVFDYNNNILYTCGTTMVDFNNPLSPVIVGYNEIGTPLSLDGDNLWCQIYDQSSDDFLVLYDRTNPYNLIPLGAVAMPHLLKSLYIYNDLAVALDGNLYLFDISDRLNWIPLDSVYLMNNLLIMHCDEENIYATTNDSLFIFNIESSGGIFEHQPDNLQPSQLIINSSPNPFNPATELTYSLQSAGEVSLVVFDITGRQVSALVKEFQTAGSHTITWNAEHQPSGVYFARLSTRNGQSQTRKLVLMK